MKSLYLRVWLAIVALLAIFAVAAGLLINREVRSERTRVERNNDERMSAWADLIQRSLPPADAPRDMQAATLRDWSQRLRMPMALDDAKGTRVATSESFERRSNVDGLVDARGRPNVMRIALDDGRTLVIFRPRVPAAVAGGGGAMQDAVIKRLWPWPQGLGLLALLSLLFVGVAAGAYPVVRRLTRRLESLKQGVEQFGAGNLQRRVDDQGRDEVAAVAKAFNQSAERIESLVRTNQSLLANASHELRSPLARMKMAVSMMGDESMGSQPAQRDRLMKEVHDNIRELDALVDEVLLASRLEAQSTLDRHEAVDLAALVAEESARTQARVVHAHEASADAVQNFGVSLLGDERLVRRAVRNLLENARRYGGGDVEVRVLKARDGASVQVRVADRGPGVPDVMKERIFEPFFRMPGHAEREGGVGLGLSLVRQIATRHGGRVHVEPREGGGSEFVLTMPKSSTQAA